MRAQVVTIANGDEFIITTETGERFVRCYETGDPDAITWCDYNHEKIADILSRRRVTSRWGGTLRGAPYWSSNFCAVGELELTEEELEYLRQLKKLTQQSADPVAVLRDIYLAEIKAKTA